MESKLLKLLIVPILSIQILIKVTTATETQSAEQIAGVPKSEVRKFLDQNENFQKIREIFAIAKKNTVTGTKDAKNKIASYDKRKLTEDMKEVLDYIASAPDKAFEEMEPMLKEIQQLNKELEEESMAYRMVARPVWSFVSNLGSLSLRAVGFTIRTAGDIIQLFSSSAQVGSDAYYQNKPAEEKEKANQVFKKINSGIGKVRIFGDQVSERGNRGLFRSESNKNRGDEKNAEEAKILHGGGDSQPKESASDAGA